MQWGVYDSMGQSGHSESFVAMDQCSEAIVTSWGQSDHSKVLGDQSGGYRMLYALSERCEDGCYV